MLNAVLALNELDTHVFDSPEPGAAPRVYDSHVTVPDAHLLFNGEFKRVGTSDLKIVGDDGESFFIPDYFTAEKRATLMSPDGATLSASVVEALAGPLAAGQLAQAGGQAASTQPVIGRVDALAGSATVVRNGVTVALNVGDNVRKGDVVQTSGSSSVAIVFSDGTTFSLNANARMVLNDFVFNAGGSGNSAAISLVQGTFSFVAGQVAKTGDMRVETPVATMGIRGTAVLVEISANDGQTRFSVMVEPDGTTGSFNLYSKTTGALIGTVNNSAVGWMVTPAGPLQVVAQQVQKTPAELQQELGIVQQIFTIFNNNQQNPFVPQQDQERRGDNPNDSNPQTAQGGGGSGTPPPNSDGQVGNALADQINHASNNPSSPPVSATVPLPDTPLPVPTDGPPAPVVTVTPNQAPIANNDGPGTLNPIDNDRDPEGAVISIQSVQHIDPEQNAPAGPIVQVDQDGEEIQGTFGTLTIRADGTNSFAPHGTAFQHLAEGQEAIEKFQYTITDPFGATATATLEIRVIGQNDEPIVSGAVTGEAEEDGASVTLSALANASDIDGDELSVVDIPSQLPPGVTYDSETQTFTLDPSNTAYQSLKAGQQTTVTVSYGVSDGTVTTPASVSWTVTGTNEAPTAGDVTLEANVLGNGGFEALPNFDGWTVDLSTDLNSVSFSSAVIDRSGGIFQGDGAVAVLSFSGQVSEAGGAGSGPSILSDTFTGSAGDTIRFVYQLSSGSSSGSSDRGTVIGRIIDAETGNVLQQIYNEADLGQSTGIQTVNVQLQYSGEFRIEFEVGSVDDTHGYVVGARLDLGFAGILRTGISEDAPFTFDADAFIANASDLDGDAITLASVATSAYGALVYINPDGTVTYDPTAAAAIQALAAGETLTDTFTFTLRDEHGAVSNQATATITVQGANDAPATVSDSAFVLAGDAVEINVLANDTDVDGDALTITGVGVAEHGTVSITEDGTIIYTPDEGYSGSDSFTYTIADPHQAGATGHVSIVVGSADHQQVGGDVFLQGNYMEIGVSSSGSLGTASNAPQGYHPQGFPRISYVVDIDGWDTGAPPTAGDFTLPGTPEDSIVIGHDGWSFANDERLSVYQIATTTTDTSSKGILSATTTGSTSSGLQLTQIVELDPGATYYKTTIILTNATEATMDDVRFMRSFDPDQDVARFGTYHTFNDVLANPAGSSDIVIAQAYGQYSGVSVNLIAFDDDARASNFGFTNHNVYADAAFNNPRDLNGAYVDEAITLTFSADDLGAGESTQFVFYTSLNGNQGGNDMLVGTGSADDLNGRGGDDIIIALGGDDTITGGAGNDRFIFSPGSGQDTILDFTAGAGTDDLIELRGFDISFETLIASATVQNGDTVLHLTDVDSIRLVGVEVAQLHRADFLLV